MNYKYDNSFNASCYSLPVAYYKQQSTSEKFPLQDAEGNFIFTALHNHAEFEIVYFTKGCGKILLGSSGVEIPFEEGDFLLVNPFELHSGYFSSDNNEFSHQCLDFSVSVLEHSKATVSQKISNALLDQTIRCDSIFSHKEEGYESLKQAFLDMYRAVETGAEDELLFLSGLYRFFSIVNTYDKIHHTRNTAVKDPNVEFVKQVLEYIEQHYSETIFTRDIAKKMTYSKEHFCRLFKNYFRTSFTAYLTQFRIEKAKILLLEESSTKVAEQCGFSSQSNFAKAFKNQVGVTPAKYRKFVTGE